MKILKKNLKLYLNNPNSEKIDFYFIITPLADIIRGLLILSLEIYFRSSHRFRSHDINLHSENKVYPIDFIKFVNNFKITNIFNSKKKLKVVVIN